MSANEHREIIELVRVVKSGYKCGPDPKQPQNTLCELMLQLLRAAPQRLPANSKSALTEFAAKIESEDKDSFQKLRQFVAGDMTWEDANPILRKDHTSNDPLAASTATDALKEISECILPLVHVLVCTTMAAASDVCKFFVEKADLCQNEEAGATSSPQVFTAWRGIGQPLVLSGDGAQFGPFMRDYRKHKFREFVSTSSLTTIKTAGYPVLLLNTQHRAVDGQFEPIYQTFYSGFKSIKSAPRQHPDNHPDAQRIEDAFVADFAGLESSPADRILSMFIHVPDSACEYIGKSRHSPLQTKAAVYVVKKLVSCDIEPTDIMVIGADKAKILELRKVLQKGILVTTADAVQGQERPYVVFVFATTKQAGPGFTIDPRRLCVSMSRQKKFLAMVGHIHTVDYGDFTPSGGNDEMLVYIVNIHKYFFSNKRVGKYEEIQHAVQDAAEVPEPFTTDTPNDVSDEEGERLRAQMEAAVAAFNEHKASRFNKSAAQSSTDSGPSQQKEISMKPMGIKQKMADFMRKASKGIPKGPSASGDSLKDDPWSNTDAGTSAWGSNDAEPSGFDGGPVDDDTPNPTAMKCKSCGDRGHYANVCPKKEPIKCHNCGEAGHVSKACPKPQKTRGPVQCFNCQEFGHMRSECTNQKVFRCRNCDEIGHHSRECPKPRDYSRVKCNNCGEMGHIAAKCKQPSQASQPLQLSQDSNAGFDEVDSEPTCKW